MAEKEYIDLYECRDDFYATVLDILSEDNTNDRANQIIDAFDCLPAADVAPVKHGHWYNRGGRFRCSVCDNKALLKDIGGTGGWSHEYEQQKSPYCPNCGAKMDGGEGK